METYFGYVRTPADAIKLFEACRLGHLPRVQRRLSEKERQSIRSGSVFVWDEREAGMRRWTDGKSWSASRVSGSFLTYREMEGKRGNGFGGSSRRSNGRTPDSGRISDEDPDGEPDGYKYKADGLMKQSFSITTSQGQHLHLISYYARPHPGTPDLPQPSNDKGLRSILPAKGMYPESSLHEPNPPALTRTPMQPYNSPPASQSEPPNYSLPWAGPAWMGPWPPSPNHAPSPTAPWPRNAAHQKLAPEIKQQQQQPPPPPPRRLQQPIQRPQQLPPIDPRSASPGHAPMSHGPLSQAPLSQAHLSQAPLSQAPYSQAPLSQAPYSQAPYSQAPFSQAPLTHAPLGHAPIYPKPTNSGHPYENERLPPPLAAPTARRPQQPPRAPSLSPRSQQLRVQAAQAVMIDPRLATTSARNPQGPYQAMPSPTRGMTPPRTHSASPPGTANSDGANGTSTSNKASLSALLLHPTPSNSEPNSANPASSNSANSSPRRLSGGASGAPPPGSDMFRGEDARALRSLDRKFCI
ncbi:Gti1/Pac2 family-domain-containing protein [Xylariaceae sp. FL0804]|nr:Gti1/Pac2 family-domain-containing protein [Xylariaceae sp. FL0804]